MKLRNKRGILEELLAEKKIQCGIEYNPRYHSWMLVWENVEGVPIVMDRLGNFWAAVQMMDIIATFDLRRTPDGKQVFGN